MILAPWRHFAMATLSGVSWWTLHRWSVCQSSPGGRLCWHQLKPSRVFYLLCCLVMQWGLRGDHHEHDLQKLATTSPRSSAIAST